MNLCASPLLRSAQANQANERKLTLRLERARIRRDELWADFFGALDTAPVPQLRDKSRMWERADIAVKKLEKVLAELETQHEWVPTVEQLSELGYKP